MKPAKAAHSHAFLKSLSSLTKHKPKLCSPERSKLATPLKARPPHYGSSDSSDEPTEIASHYKQHVAKPKLFMPASSIARDPKPKQW